jgi:BASS family bile acid:Na+ symporter
MTNGVVALAFQASLFAVVFGYGLTARFCDLRYVLGRPGLLARSLLATVVLMPVLAVAMARLFDLRHTVEIALVALAVSPLPPLLPHRQGKAGGATSYGLGLVVLLAVLSIGLIPLAAQLLGVVFHRSYVASPVTVSQIMLISVLAPLVAGMATHRWLPAVADRIRGPVAKAQLVFAPTALLLAVATSGSAMWQLIGNGTLIALGLFVALGFAAGHLLGGSGSDTSAVLAFSTACRHPATATAIASMNFPDTDIHAAIVLYVIVTAVFGLAYSRWLRRQRDTGTVMTG